MTKTKATILNLIIKYRKIQNGNFLEIGGIPSENDIAIELIDRYNANEIVQINLRKDLKNIKKDYFKFYNMDARNTNFQANSFDNIYGTAILEHIHELDKFFDEMYRILKTGGMIFLHGVPLWSSKWGHHIWIDSNGNKYRFNDIDLNPIDNWSHLYYTPDEMKTFLLSKNILDEDVKEIINMVYYSSTINRISYLSLLNIIKKSKFTCIEIIAEDWGSPKQDISNKINEEFTNIGATFIVLKKL